MAHPDQWYRIAVCATALLGTFLAASGLLQLNEVIFSSTAVPRGAQPTADLTRQTAFAQAAIHPTRHYDRLVILLIDALRADMVLGTDNMYGREASVRATTKGDELSDHMQYTKQLLASGIAAGYVAHASIPTVTMPRLKALLSGKPPAFIDILKNFNAAALEDENIVQLFRERDDRIVFYGDDTWLKLFPDAFQRYDSTSGFYTRDTVEVDDNVTRHLRDELDPTLQNSKSQDWDVLVLHYLGLDHVGHLRGPRSSMMEDKLHEMDTVVQMVYESVKSQDAIRRERDGSDFKPTLIVLCSDHGMSEIGNHGGATVEESSALMTFMSGDGKSLGASTHNAARRLQVDLVPTIAALFGLRIPRYSSGRVIEDVVTRSCENEPNVELIKALYANLVQLRILADIKFPGLTAKMNLADIEARVQATISAPSTSKRVGDDKLVEEIRVLCTELQARVAGSDGSEYDLPKIGSGVLLLLLSTFCALYRVVCSPLLCNNLSIASWLALVSLTLTIVSLSSTSSIENEHGTVFFFLSSMLFAVAVDLLKSAKTPSTRRQLVLLGMCLVGIRLLRERSQVINFGRLNHINVDPSQPGNEFANDDSLSVWFTGPLFASIPAPSIVFFAVTYVVIVSRIRIVSSAFVKVLVLLVFTTGCVANWWLSSVVEVESDDRTLINHAAKTVYGAAALLVLLGCIGRSVIASSEMALWLVILLVQKPSNVPTLTVLCIVLDGLSALFRSVTPSPLIVSSVSLWLAFASFFALGNSHLVTTIDISQSYHGLDGYSQGIVGMLTFVNVFSGPLVAFVRSLDWVQWSTSQAKSNNTTTPTQAAWIILTYQTLRMAVYTIIVYFMRFHLFIWSVFAPKMLYEVAFTGLVLAFAMIC